MSKEEVIGFLNDMIDALTWKRVGLLSLLATCSISLVIGFENRGTIINRVFDKPVEVAVAPWELSDTSKSALLKLSGSQPILAGVVVTEVNLKKNRRQVKYLRFKDDQFQANAVAIANTALPQAFFNDDRKNNDQMLAVLNNQFLCVQTSDTIWPNFYAGVQKTFPYVCRLAVPPFAGEFAGLITLFLTRQPSPWEIDALKIELSRISIELYLRDIGKRRR